MVEFTSEWTSISSYDHSNPDPAIHGSTTDYTTDGDEDPRTGDLDPFGRVHRTVGTLNTANTDKDVIEYEYFGTNKSVTVHDIRGEAGDIDATTTYYSDGFGNLRAVDSPEGADAVYEYDMLGNLTKVNLVSNLALSPTSTDRYATTNTDEQIRTFTYDNLGRQTTATHPENGTVTTLEWNAMGAPTQVQDALGVARGHLHQTSYDSAGRPTMVERVLDATQQSFLDEEEPSASSNWTKSGWSSITTTNCLSAIEAAGGPTTAWSHGDSNCSYADTAAQTATLTSDSIGPLPKGANLSFEYLREVRSTASDQGKDRLTVLIKTSTQTWGEAEELYTIDSSQISWVRWKRTPAIPLSQYADQTIEIRFQFESEDYFSNNGTRRGVFLGNVTVSQPQSTTLIAVGYDEDFNIGGNKARGKVTSVNVYDESTQQPTWQREYQYLDNEGRLRKEMIEFDWDRSGNLRPFTAEYNYDDMGRLYLRNMPHPVQETDPREYNYTFRHGVLVGITSNTGVLTQTLVDDTDIATPGIEFNLAGGLRLLRYGNGLRQQFVPNDAFLPSEIYVDDDQQNVLFTTGAYAYDGARNIQTIGADQYYYDAAMRLDQASVVSTQRGTATIDYSYDRFGNMLSRSATGDVPLGLHFQNRSYSYDNGEVTVHDNRIHDSEFLYDANGNLIEEPKHGCVGAVCVGGYRYRFSPENRIPLIQSLTNSKVLQESQYDEGGNRWVRSISTDGGQGLITLRDASGKVVSEYKEIDADSGLVPHKEYVQGNGNLIAVNVYCGPRPALALDNPMRVGDEYKFVKTTYVDPVDGWDSYTIFIESEGQTNTLYRSHALPDHFAIHEDELFIGNNWIRIEMKAECGNTGYSNAVSINRSEGGGCLEQMASYRNYFGSGGSSALNLEADTGGCTPGTLYNAYYERRSTAEILLLNPGMPLPVAKFSISNMPAGAGHGEYWFVAVDPGTMQEGVMSPMAGDDERSTGADTGGLPGYPSVNPQYMHWDHLGSTRLITDEVGQEIASYKYYPFGQESEITDSTDNRMKFTGHERDDGLGLDYMLARYYGASLACFISVDPIGGRGNNPKTWNSYTYVRNNPLSLVDPDGRLERDASGKLKVTLGPIITVEHAGDPNHVYVVQEATLYTDVGNPISATTVMSGGKAGDIIDKSTGTVAAHLADSSNPMATDCHGVTFADSQYWINNDQVSTILADEYTPSAPGTAAVGDVYIYSDAGGDIVHSTTVSETTGGTPSKVKGLGGLETTTKESPAGTGPGTGWSDPNATTQTYKKK